ncbi:MAG: hydantoinase/oxoprolinase family protein [Planctomycetes bacterium]|nr:hydantoinase/oxoprolinase family protein [Planctomycetota bacterium]
MPPSRSPLRIAIDTGGTFTDLVAEDEQGLRVEKLPSTPDDPSRAIFAGWHALDPEARAAQILHGSTVGLNALLTLRGARTALVVTKGFADLLDIGRGHREHLYDLGVEKPAPLVPRALRFELAQRTAADGEELLRPSDAELEKLRERLRRARVESIAVVLLHSWRDPEPERRVAQALAPLGVPISLSSSILPRFREVERASATVINAYLAPLMAAYLAKLESGFGKRPLALLQNHGGLVRAATAAERPVEVLFSGPAGGVVGAASLAQELGVERVLSFDMGGTSTDVCLAGERLARSDEVQIGGRPLGLSSLDLHTVGCGGGSIAWADSGGALKVGPQSAGASPGPACYGVGEEPTITDAHLLLGRLPTGTFLGGKLALDVERARAAYEGLGAKLGLDALAAAEGALRIADAAMSRALKVISLERGIDPTRCPLVAFGGAGGLHAARLARLLRLPSAILPPNPGAFSARGMLAAVPAREWTRSVALLADEPHAPQLARAQRELLREARAGMRAELPRGTPFDVSFRAAMRYRGQSFELELPLDGDPRAAFHREHARVYGFELARHPIEIVHLTAEARARRESRKSVSRRSPRAYTPKPLSRAAGFAIYERASLRPGAAFAGPALLLEYSATSVVERGDRARVDAAGNVHLLPGRRR